MKPGPSITEVQSNAHLFEQLSQLIAGIRYGTVELTIHDGRVVQIERREKLRFNSRSSPLK